MGDGLLSYLSRITMPEIRQAIRLVADRLSALESRVTTLDDTALKTGSPVDAYGQRIKQVGDPKVDSDAATLGYVRKYVHAVIKAQTPIPRPTRDAGSDPVLPLPIGTFTATPDSLPFGGGAVTFQWTSQYADTVEASGFGFLPLSGSAVLTVTTSTSYTLILRGPGGISYYSLTVTVATTPAPTPAPTGTFQAIPTTIAPGTPVTLTWTSLNATTATISPGVGAVSPVAVGTTTVQPLQTTTYELRLDGPGGIRIYTVTVTVTPVNPPPPTPTGYNAGVLGWGFGNNGVRYEWRGFTAFTLLHDFLHPEHSARAFYMLDHFAARGCTVPRVLCSLAGSFWEDKGFRLYPPEHTDFGEKLIALVRACNDRGMMPEIVLFGAFSEIWGTNWEAMREYVRYCARTLLPYRGCFVEIANEWNAIGFTSGEQIRILAQDYLAVDSARVVACSSATGDDDGYTGFLQAPSVYLTVHIGRDQSLGRSQWITRHYGNPTIMHGLRPAVSDEPVNAGDALYGIHEPDPQYWYAFGAISRLMGFSTTFHYEGGLFDQTPGGVTAECLAAWVQALSYPSPDGGGALFAATPAGVAFGPCPWPNSGSNRGLIGRTTSGGSAYGLCFGAATLPSVSAGWGSVLVDGFTTGFPIPGVTPRVFSEIRGYVVYPAGF